MSKLLTECIASCYSCAKVCTECADGCVAQSSAEDLRTCIRVNLDCADVCIMAARVASRCSGSTLELMLRVLELTAAMTRACADACEAQAHRHEACRACAAECRRCTEACTLAMQDVGGASGLIQTN